MLIVFFFSFTSYLSSQLQVTGFVHALAQRGCHALPAIEFESPLEFLMSIILFLPSGSESKVAITPLKICRHTDVKAPAPSSSLAQSRVDGQYASAQ
ncbi:hypothetical protein BJY01DRAFT_24332 [Aspergillus pseudoustus]|uniref:Secreted protein n=1 Tax=Aspergillus pseudoustus TaxID=1810923 RepID=A0ABR4JJJ6_9EURO